MGRIKIGRRDSEVLADKNITRFASYSSFDKQSLDKLDQAIQSKDESTARDIIANNSAYDFVGNLMNIYGSTVFEIGKKILDSNRLHLSPRSKSLAKAGAFQPKVAPFEKRDYFPKKSITQKQRGTGKTYNRSKPVRFSKREKTFLMNNANKNNVELTRLYNQYFAKRSKSSIVTKKYRLKKVKRKK